MGSAYHNFAYSFSAGLRIQRAASQRKILLRDAVHSKRPQVGEKPVSVAIERNPGVGGLKEVVLFPQVAWDTWRCFWG